MAVARTIRLGEFRRAWYRETRNDIEGWVSAARRSSFVELFLGWLCPSMFAMISTA